MRRAAAGVPGNLPLNRRNEEVRRTLIERRKREIALRVRPVCQHMPSDDFDQLVEQMATIEIKYAMRRDATFADDSGGLPKR